MDQPMLNFARYTAAWSDDARRAALDRFESSVACWADEHRRDLEARLDDTSGGDSALAMRRRESALRMAASGDEGGPEASSDPYFAEWARDACRELDAIVLDVCEGFSAAEVAQLRTEAHTRLAAVDVEADVDLSGGCTPGVDELPDDWYEIKSRVEALHRAPPVRRHSFYERHAPQSA